MRSQRHRRFFQGKDSTGSDRYPGSGWVWDWPNTWPSGSGSFSVALTGLTEGVAVIGTEATISYTVNPPGTETVMWGTAPGDDEYGTAESPTDISGGDGDLLYATITRDGVSVTIVAPIQYPAPDILTDALVSGTPEVGQTLTGTPATFSGGSVTVTNQWQESVDDAIWVNAASSTVNGPPLSFGLYYRFLSLGTNSGGQALSISESVGPVTNPLMAPERSGAPVPTVLSDTAIDVANGAIPADNGSAITGYDLRYGIDEVSWTELLDVTFPVSLTGLTTGLLYYFQVRAKNAIGNGAWSVSASAATEGVPQDSLLLENGSRLLLETGGRLLTENIVEAAFKLHLETGDNLLLENGGSLLLE